MTSSRPLFIFQKRLIPGKSKWPAAYFQFILIALNLAYNKNKLYETLDYSTRDMHPFNFLEENQGLVYPPDFVYDFSRKMFFMLHSIN